MDSINLTQVAIAFGALLVLLGLFWYGARVFSGGSRISKMRPNQRIGVVETAAVDGNRRLVLVRRDDTEHLLLLGSHGDLVIESNIPLPPADAASPAPTGRGGRLFGSDQTAARQPAEPRQPDQRAAEPRPSEQSGGWPTLRVPGRNDPGRDGGRDR